MKQENVEISPEALSLMQSMTGSFADRFIQSQVIHPMVAGLRTSSDQIEEIREKALNPYWAIHLLFSHYVFARRGKERNELSQTAYTALRRLSNEQDFPTLLDQTEALQMWVMFEEICQERKLKRNEQLNRGIIQGLFELAQELHQERPGTSIFGWIQNKINQTGRVELAFERLVDIRGMGPKTSSMILRDCVWLYELEDQVDFADRLYLQPVDRWLRGISTELIPELAQQEEAADWIVAGKVSKYARRFGMSGIRLNMGMIQYGISEITALDHIQPVLKKRLESLRTTQ